MSEQLITRRALIGAGALSVFYFTYRSLGNAKAGYQDGANQECNVLKNTLAALTDQIESTKGKSLSLPERNKISELTTQAHSSVKLLSNYADLIAQKIDYIMYPGFEKFEGHMENLKLNNRGPISADDLSEFPENYSLTLSSLQKLKQSGLLDVRFAEKETDAAAVEKLITLAQGLYETQAALNSLPLKPREF